MKSPLFPRTVQLVCLVLVSTLGSVSAQVVIEWSGATNTAWATGINWTGNVAPASDLTTNVASFNAADYPNQPNSGTRSIAGLSIGDASAALTISGTSLTLGASGITKTAASNTPTTISSAVVLGAAQSWSDASPTGGLTVSGILSGAADAGLTKTGAGVLTLSGANTYAGGTTISEGTVVAGNDAAFGTSAIILNGGNLRMGTTGTRTIANNIVANLGTTTVIDQGEGDTIYNGNLSGSGTLNFIGTSNTNMSVQVTSATANWSGFTGVINWDLSSSNGMSQNFILFNGAGGLDLSNATVNLANTGAGMNRAFRNNASAGVALKIGALIGTSAAVMSGSSGGVFEIGHLNTNTTYAGRIGAIQGDVAVRKVGTGTLTLSGANTYTGSTTIDAGTLQLGASEVFAASAFVFGGGTLDLNAFSDTVGTLTINTASVINFGIIPGTNSISFADSSATDWLGTITLQNFEFGVDILKFGVSATALTATQLGKISLAGYTATGLDATGVVQFSAVPEPSVLALAGAGLATLLIFKRRRVFLG